MGTPLNVEGFRHKLASMNSTQDSVQTMALWVAHHRSHFKQIVEVWIQSMRDATKESHRLTLMYLVNDVIQNSRRKGVTVFKDAFASVLEEAASLCRDESIRKNVLRIITIWEERSIFDNEFCEKLLAASVSTQSLKPKVDAKFLSTFNPADVPSAIENLTQFEGEVELKRNQLNNMNVDVASIESIAKLKDRAGGKRFSEQFEDGAIKLEEYVKSLRKEVEMRKELLEVLKKSEIFYDAQFSEAKIVTNAYKNFSTRVSILKKRLEEYKKHLPTTKGSSPIPSPSVDAPSPGATPPDDPEADKVDVEDMEVSDEEDGVQHGSIMAVSTASTKRAHTKTTRIAPPPDQKSGNLEQLAKLTGASFLTGGLSFKKLGSATDTPSPTGSNNSAPSPENSPSDLGSAAEEPPVKTESPQTIPIINLQQEDSSDSALYGSEAMPTTPLVSLVPYTDQADEESVKEENATEESRDGSTPLRDEMQTGSNLQKVVNEATANPIAFLSKIIHSTKTSTASGSGPSHSFISSLSMLTKSVQSAVAKENVTPPSKEHAEKPEDTSRKKDPLKDRKQVSQEKAVPSSKASTHPFGLGQFLASLNGGSAKNNEGNDSVSREVDSKEKENSKKILSYSSTAKRSAFGNVSEIASPEDITSVEVSTPQQFVNTTTSTTLTSASSNLPPFPPPAPPPIPPPNEPSHELPDLPPGPPPGPPPPNARRGPSRSFDESEEDQGYNVPADAPASEPSVIMYEMEPDDDDETDQISYEDQYNSDYDQQGTPFSNFQLRNFEKPAPEQQVPPFSNFQEGNFDKPAPEQQVPPFSTFQDENFNKPGIEQQVSPFGSIQRGTFNRLREEEPVTSFSNIQRGIYTKPGTEEQSNFYPNIQGGNFTKPETEQQLNRFPNVQPSNFTKPETEHQVNRFPNIQGGNFTKPETEHQVNRFPNVQGGNFTKPETEHQVNRFPNVQGGNFTKPETEHQVNPFPNVQGVNFTKLETEHQVNRFPNVQGSNFTKPETEHQVNPFSNVQGGNFMEPEVEQQINPFRNVQGGNFANQDIEPQVPPFPNVQGGNFTPPDMEQQTMPFPNVQGGNFTKADVEQPATSFINTQGGIFTKSVRNQPVTSYPNVQGGNFTKPETEQQITPYTSISGGNFPKSVYSSSYSSVPVENRYSTSSISNFFANPPVSVTEAGYNAPHRVHQDPIMPSEQIPTSRNEVGFGTPMLSEGDVSHLGNEERSFSHDLHSPPADITSPISVIGGSTQYPYPPSSEPTSPSTSIPVLESREYSPPDTIPVLGQTSLPPIPVLGQTSPPPIPVLGQTSPPPWSPPDRGTFRNDQDVYRTSHSTHPYSNYHRESYTGSSYRRGGFSNERNQYDRPYRPRGRGNLSQNWYGDTSRRNYPRSRPFNYR